METQIRVSVHPQRVRETPGLLGRLRSEAVVRSTEQNAVVQTHKATGRIDQPTSGLGAAPRPFERKVLVQLGLACVSLGYLWFVLIRHLSIEWSVNEQYTYGWAVPFLC